LFENGLERMKREPGERKKGLNERKTIIRNNTQFWVFFTSFNGVWKKEKSWEKKSEKIRQRSIHKGRKGGCSVKWEKLHLQKSKKSATKNSDERVQGRSGIT